MVSLHDRLRAASNILFSVSKNTEKSCFYKFWKSKFARKSHVWHLKITTRTSGMIKLHIPMYFHERSKIIRGANDGLHSSLRTLTTLWQSESLVTWKGVYSSFSKVLRNSRKANFALATILLQKLRNKRLSLSFPKVLRSDKVTSERFPALLHALFAFVAG